MIFNGHVAQLEERRLDKAKVAGAEPAVTTTHPKVAQLVEQGAENPCVGGAIPSLGATFTLNGRCQRCQRPIVNDQMCRGWFFNVWDRCWQHW